MLTEAGFLSANPAKRRAELWLLAYSPLWIGAIAALQLSRCFTRWGDLGHMLIGLAFALPLWLMPFLAERDRPLPQRYLSKAIVYITVLSFVQNLFGARLFFEGLGMQYHFNVRLVLDGTPLFLYLVTVAYFSTYYVLQQVTLRAFLRRWPGASATTRWAIVALLSYTTAFAETLFMANDWLRDVFSYADKARALWVGSLCYGTLFLISLPPFFRIDEDPRRPTSMGRVARDALAANMLILLAHEAYLGGLLRRL